MQKALTRQNVFSSNSFFSIPPAFFRFAASSASTRLTTEQSINFLAASLNHGTTRVKGLSSTSARMMKPRCLPRKGSGGFRGNSCLPSRLLACPCSAWNVFQQLGPEPRRQTQTAPKMVIRKSKSVMGIKMDKEKKVLYTVAHSFFAFLSFLLKKITIRNHKPGFPLGAPSIFTNGLLVHSFLGRDCQVPAMTTKWATGCMCHDIDHFKSCTASWENCGQVEHVSCSNGSCLSSNRAANGVKLESLSLETLYKYYSRTILNMLMEVSLPMDIVDIVLPIFINHSNTTGALES